VPYEWIEVTAAELQTPAYRQLNPNASMPTLVDGELVLWESMAINLYLAERYDGGLWPATVRERAELYRWTLWGVNEAEPHVVELFRQRRVLVPLKRNERKALEAEARLHAALPVLDGALAEREYLIGTGFSAADLNLASILSTSLLSNVDISEHARVARWLNACLARPYPVQYFETAAG
jgi:glutathione S-transferase